MERLYNNIVLPDIWPPRNQETTLDKPLAVPYLQNKPDVIDISVGRQLFVDDFLIAQTDLQREEVGAFARSAGAGRREHDGVAEADEAGTVGEAGDFAGGDFHLPLAVELENDFFFSHDRFPFLLLGC